MTEDVIRGGAAAIPQTAPLVVVSEVVEAAGHAARDRYNMYYDMNIMQHTDPFERAWDAAQRANDLP